MVASCHNVARALLADRQAALELSTDLFLPTRKEDTRVTIADHHVGLAIPHRDMRQIHEDIEAEAARAAGRDVAVNRE